MKVKVFTLLIILPVLACFAEEKRSGLLFGASPIPDQRAAGVFIKPSNNVQIQSGLTFGAENDWAGFAGLKIKLGRLKDKKSFLQKD